MADTNEDVSKFAYDEQGQRRWLARDAELPPGWVEEDAEPEADEPEPRLKARSVPKDDKT